MPSNPTVIFVSRLLAGENLEISWNEVLDAVGYEVDAYLPTESNGTVIWNWEMIYNGAGTAISVINTGLSWSELDAFDRTWDAIDDLDWTWDAFEEQQGVGMTWDRIDAKYLQYAEFDAEDFSWDELDTMTDDNSTRLSCLYPVPDDLTATMLRIRAYDSDNNYSGYLTTNQLYVIYPTQEISIVNTNAYYSIQVDGELIRSFAGESLELIFDDNKLDFLGYSWMNDRKPVPIPHSLPTVYHGGNCFYIRCAAEISEVEIWSGLILKVIFQPLVIGKTTDQLTYQNTTVIA